MADVAKLKSSETFSLEELLKLSDAIDKFERYDRPHAARMAQLAEIMAIRIGISGADLNSLKLAALLHDIGELIMDAPAVRAEGYLDFKRRIELWRHPVIGEQQAAKRDLPRQVQLLIRWHHEWWNGAGYPDMLAGEAIPIAARILRLTDTYDSLTASRPYREPFEETQARAIISASAGIEFDPLVVKIFLEIMEELDRRAEEERAEKERAAAAVSIEEISVGAAVEALDVEPEPTPSHAAEPESEAAPESANESADDEMEIIVEPIAEPTVEPVLEQNEELLVEIEPILDSAEATQAAPVDYEVLADSAPLEPIERSAHEEKQSEENEGKKSLLEEDAEH